MNRILFVAAGAVLIAAFFIGSWYYNRERAEELGSMAQEQASVFVRPHSPILGSDDARVTLVKFSDPACETCASFSPFVKQGLDTFPGQLKLVLRYAPFHEGSDDVVRILEAARKQGKFWETLEMLYERQNVWTRHHRVILSAVWPLLPEVGLDVERVYVSVYKDDDESYALWRDKIGVPEKRIYRFGDIENGDDENFWSMGPTGPCGPCTELF